MDGSNYSKVWVVTREINEYNQDGEYFFGVFLAPPSVDELRRLFYTDSYADDIESVDDQLRDAREKFIARLLLGGGRVDVEDEWFHLFEYDVAKSFIKQRKPMNLSSYERKLYVRPIRSEGGSIYPQTHTIDVTNIERGENGMPNDVKNAIDFWVRQGYTVKQDGQTIQWVNY